MLCCYFVACPQLLGSAEEVGAVGAGTVVTVTDSGMRDQFMQLLVVATKPVHFADVYFVCAHELCT